MFSEGLRQSGPAICCGLRFRVAFMARQRPAIELLYPADGFIQGGEVGVTGLATP